MNPFEAIPHVGTALALAAFVVAVAAWLVRAKLQQEKQLIESAPADKKAELVLAKLRDVGVVNPEKLTKEQQYTLAMRMIDERARRFRTGVFAGLFVAVLLAGLVGVERLRGDPVTQLTVRVQRPGGAPATSGQLTLDAAGTSVTRQIDGEGVVQFTNVLRNALDRGVTVTPRVPGYAAQPTTLKGPPDSVHTLQLEPVTTRVYGMVVDAAGLPAAGVVLHFDGGVAVDTTDAAGRFETALRQPPGARVPVRALDAGALVFHDLVTILEDEALTLRLGGS